MKSKLVSLSAISAALTALCLVVGAYFEIAEICSLVISSVFVILPVYYKSYKASVLAALVGGLIAFLCSGFNITSVVFPSFAVFFGFYPTARFKMKDKGVKTWLTYLIGGAWCLLTVYGMYFYYTAVTGLILTDLPLWLIDGVLYFLAPFGIIVYFIYDKFLIVSKRFMDKYLAKIVK